MTQNVPVRVSRPQLPPEIEEYRDGRWRRDAVRQVSTAFEAERFIEDVGFAACLTDCRRPGPSLYVAVCGRRDAVLPRNVQKDSETSLTWQLKDELVRRGKVYYAKLARGKTMFLAPRMIPHFHAIWGLRRSEEKTRLSRNAQKILRVLRREWEMSTLDLRTDSGVTDRKAFTRALDELQAAMIVVPSEVCYLPKFTYIWTLGVGRFPDALVRRVKREHALREIARCFLTGAGVTVPGEMARVTGLPGPKPGLATEHSSPRASPACSGRVSTDWSVDEGTEVTEGTERASKTEKQRNRDTATNCKGSSRCRPGRRPGRAIDRHPAGTSRLHLSPAACVRGVSVDRSPRWRGGIGGAMLIGPSVSLFLRVEARSVNSVNSVIFIDSPPPDEKHHPDPRRLKPETFVEPACSLVVWCDTEGDCDKRTEASLGDGVEQCGPTAVPAHRRPDEELIHLAYDPIQFVGIERNEEGIALSSALDIEDDRLSTRRLQFEDSQGPFDLVRRN